jgi:hypothetical protein
MSEELSFAAKTPRAAAASQLLEMARAFPERGPEWKILLKASTELFDLDKGRCAHRQPDEPDPLVHIAVSLCCASGDNATTVARFLDNAFNPGNRAGSKNRIDDLAKKTRQALAKLSPAEVEELAASMRQPLTAKIVGSGITTVARR